MGVGFTVLMVFMFASGVFIPSAFLPVWIEKAGAYLPYKVWMEGMVTALQGRYDIKTTAMILAVGVFSLAAGILAAMGRAYLAARGKGRHK